MPKIVNYPRKSFETAMEIAETVEKLGGKCTEQILGTKLGRKKGGSFDADINSAVKHGLVEKMKDTLKITDLFKNIKLAYTDDEKKGNLAKSFLIPDTYREILERFNGNELPIDVLDKMLIKEYNVASNASQTVANNLIKGAEKLGLIVNGKVSVATSIIQESIVDVKKDDKNNGKDKNNATTASATKETNPISSKIVETITGGSTIQKDVVININIQLTVPETTNEEVYEKFFAAMKKNLLS